jgi:simple sugar transport system permease protein/ribose transport system permease protein
LRSWLGEALVITTGEIDISVGSIFGIVGLTYLGLAPHVGAPLAILIALAAAVAIGAVNGFVVAYFRLPSLIVTLGSLFVFRGLAYAVTQKSPYTAARPQVIYRLFGDADVFGHNNALVGACCFLFLQYVLFYSGQPAFGGGAMPALTHVG